MTSIPSQTCNSLCTGNHGIKGAIISDAFFTPEKPRKTRALRNLSNNSQAFVIDKVILANPDYRLTSLSSKNVMTESKLDQISSSTCDSKDSSRDNDLSDKSSRADSVNKTIKPIGLNPQQFGILSNNLCFLNFPMTGVFSEAKPKNSSKPCRRSSQKISTDSASKKLNLDLSSDNNCSET
jgi:hypothetical protein